MPSSACVTDRFAGRGSRARAGSFAVAASTSSVCWPTAGCGPCTAGVGAPCSRNEMPAWRTGPCTGSSTTTDIPLLITCSSSSASCAWRTGAIAISLAQNWSSRSWRFILPIASRITSSNAWPPVGFHSRSGGSMPRISHTMLRSLPRPPAKCIECTHSPSAHS